MEFFEMKFDESLIGAAYEDRTRGVGCFDATNGPDIKISPTEVQSTYSVKNMQTGLTVKNATFRKLKK